MASPRKKAAKKKPDPAQPEAPPAEMPTPAAPTRDPKLTKIIGSVATRINKKHKDSIVPVMQTGREYSPACRLRRPTGIMSLDLKIAGGPPAGCMTEIISKDSVGKTTLGTYICAENQRIYGAQSVIAMVGVEGPVDKEHSRDCGMRIAFAPQELADMEKAQGLKFDPKLRKAMLEDQIGEVYFPREESGERLLDIILDLVRSDLFQIIMIDSVPALISEDEDEKDMDDKMPARLARMIAKFCRKWAVRPCRTSLIMLNQFRIKLGAKASPGVDVMQIPGGWALRHYKSLSLKLVSTPRDRIKDKETGQLIGKDINWEIIKQKHGGHEGDEGTYRYLYGTHQVERAYDAFSVGLGQHIVKRRGAYYDWEGTTYQGEDEIVEALKNSDARDRLMTQITEALGTKFLVGQ